MNGPLLNAQWDEFRKTQTLLLPAAEPKSPTAKWPQGSSQVLCLILGFTEDYFCLFKNFTYMGIESLGILFLSDSSTLFFLKYRVAEEGMVTHSRTLAWKIPWTEEPGRLQSMGSLRVGHDWATSLSLFTFMHWRRKWQPTPVFLPGEIPGTGEPDGLPSMGSHRVGQDWSDLAAAAAGLFFGGLQLGWREAHCGYELGPTDVQLRTLAQTSATSDWHGLLPSLGSIICSGNHGTQGTLLTFTGLLPNTRKDEVKGYRQSDD